MRWLFEVTVEPDRLMAAVRRGRRTVWSGECDSAGRELTDAIRGLRAQTRLPERCRRVRFVVKPPLVQHRMLKGLPPVRSGELRRLVEQQSHRFFRRRDCPLMTSAAWCDRTKSVAAAAALGRDLADALEASASENQMRLVGIVAVTGRDNRPIKFRGARPRSTELYKYAAIVLLFVMWISGSYLAGYALDLEIDRRSLNRELDRLRPELDVLDAVRREIADVVRVVGTVDSAAARRGWVTRLLSLVAVTLPTNAHLISFSATHEQVTINLRARDVSAILDSLASAPDPTFSIEVGERMAGGEGEWDRATVRMIRGAVRASP